MKYDVLILGGGPAGLAAALYAKRAGVSVLVLERSIYGGQVTNTPTVENYPGILNISGVDLAMALYEQVTGLGIEVRLEEPVSYQLDAPAKAVATARGRGVSYCATCDGAFFQGAEVAIVGGGNTALEDALFLSNNCAAVHLIHRRDQFRGSSILAEAVKKRQNIHLHLNSVVEEITGEEKVAGARLRDVTTGEETRLELSGVFVAVGLAPDNAAFAGQLALDGAGYIQAGEDCRTNLAGVFAAGDTRTKEVRQIITAAADGAVAALGAANYVNSLE